MSDDDIAALVKVAPGGDDQDCGRGSRGASHPRIPLDSRIHPYQYADNHQRQLRLQVL